MTILDNISERDYRAMPGLSGAQVATLLESPAKFRWELDHPRQSTKAMTFGTIVHALVLGRPLPVVVSEYADFKTKAAQEWKATQEASGLIVVKQADLDAAFDAAAAVDRHPVASALLKAPGKSEVAVKAEHRGYIMRGRLDRLPDVGPVLDFKTDKDITPSGIQWSMAEYGYATQLGHYAKITGRPVNDHRIGGVTSSLVKKGVLRDTGSTARSCDARNRNRNRRMPIYRISDLEAVK